MDELVPPDDCLDANQPTNQPISWISTTLSSSSSSLPLVGQKHEDYTQNYCKPNTQDVVCWMGLIKVINIKAISIRHKIDSL